MQFLKIYPYDNFQGIKLSHGLDFFHKKYVFLLEEIENKFNIKLQGKYFIGDKESDIIAGLNHVCEPILIQTGGYGEKVLKASNCPPSEHCFDNLYDACEFIINKK